MEKPRLASGTRDFGAKELNQRYYIIDKMKSVFESFAFTPIETPAFELLETLMGKYGEEGDKLIFKILNNGLHEKKESDKIKINASFEKILNQSYSSTNITERALRYDLTIPFARYISMNRNELQFPFKRYQIQPVWRADKPQNGRYREFYQCDIDIIGSDNLAYEAEALSIYNRVFNQLQIPELQILVNNRKILIGLASYLEVNQVNSFISIIDKLDKIQWNGVQQKLLELGISENKCAVLKEIFDLKGNYFEKLNALEAILHPQPLAVKGIEELRETFKKFESLDNLNNTCIQFDITLARGLDYYTGMITEVKTNAVKIGSLGGGGRYDNLTELFGFPNMSGIGVSFGLDRIYDVMSELKLFPIEINQNIKVLLAILDEEAEEFVLKSSQFIRDEFGSVEIIYDKKKVDKIFKSAEIRSIPYVGLIGKFEAQNQTIKLKNIFDSSIKEIKIHL